MACASLISAPAIAAPEGRDAAAAAFGEYRKIVTEKGIERTEAIEIGGVRQWVSIRGRDRDNPILLYLHGGPGAAAMPYAFLFQSPWEEYFTVVQWDQRGAGRTYGANDPASVTPTLTIDRMVEDAAELIGWLQKTYGKRKVIVFGHSWGTIMGTHLAERHPDLIAAYVAAGPVINMKQGLQISQADGIASARKMQNEKAIKALTTLRPADNRDVDAAAMIETLTTQFGGMLHNRTSWDPVGNAMEYSPDYNPADFDALNKGIDISYRQMNAELMAVDFDGLRKIDCPVFVYLGRHDTVTPPQLAERWIGKLNAPRKGIVWFENSAHMLPIEEPGKMLLHLVQDVRPLALPPSR